MQCSQHPDREGIAYCTNCGKAICSECQELVDSRVLCASCAPQFTPPPIQAQPPLASGPDTGLAATPQPDTEVGPSIPIERGYPYCSPGICFVLGLIPGVGAVCNGDYFKAFIQVLVFGTLVSLASSGESGQLAPMLSMLAIALYLYMPVEAYHVSKKRTLALRGIIVMTPFEKIHFSEIWAGVLAIGLGTMFLVNQYVPGTLRFIMRGWPLLLIALGAYNLVRYFRSSVAA